MDSETLLHYFATQRFLFIAEQCLNLTKKCLAPVLRAHGLNHSQYLVLLALRYAELAGQEVISTELASLLAREKHTITPLVESLARRGYLLRRRRRPDRRAIDLSLSGRGRALIEEVQPQTMNTIAQLSLNSERPGPGGLPLSRGVSPELREVGRRDPDLYQDVYDRLLIGGEAKLLAQMRKGASPSRRPRSPRVPACR